MLIVLFVFGIILFVIGVCKDDIDIGPIIGVPGLVISLASLIVGIILAISVSCNAVIDSELAMYTEENAAIEERIASVVDQYQEYETKIFTEVTPENALGIVMTYPELKSNDLVAQQIELYISNNEKIKELKTEKLYDSVKRWWLYFGG